MLRFRQVALYVACALATVFSLTGCFSMRSSDGGGRAEFTPPRVVDPDDVALPAGYQIEVVAEGLTFPSGVTFDDRGRLYVVEAGYSYGEVWTTPRLVRIDEPMSDSDAGASDGMTIVIATGDNPPWNGVVYADGAFFIAEGGHRDGGRILRVDVDGAITPIVEDLPSLGDHHTNGPAIGPDGMLYFGQGTATNSGVVGVDNAEFGWLARHPTFHDIPGGDVTLTGANFTTRNPLAGTNNEDAGIERREEVATGAYLPFGTPAAAGQIIRGQIPCTGAIMRIAPEGGDLELVAWGLRNPFGLAFSPDGALYVTDNSYDVRGSRPVFGTGDLLWRIEEGAWYGWPDFHGRRALAEDDQYTAPGAAPPAPLLASPPGIPPEPIAILGVHSSSNGLDFSHNDSFGHVGEAFVAQFGDMAPGAGKVLAPVGYKVVRVNTDTGVIEDFAVNKGKEYGPASRLKRERGGAGLERPVDVKFSPDGSELYIVDFGVMTMDGGEKNKPRPREGTGVLWRITRAQRAAVEDGQ